MSQKEITNDLAYVLLSFVKEAASTKATEEEVEALPAVARVLVDLLALNQNKG